MRLRFGSAVAIEQLEDALVAPGFGDEVAGAALHGRNGELDGAPCRHDDERRARAGGVKTIEQGQAFFAGGSVARVVHIEQDDVVIGFAGMGHGGCGGSGEVACVSASFKQEAHGFENIGMVVHHENAAGVYCFGLHVKEIAGMGPARRTTFFKGLGGPASRSGVRLRTQVLRGRSARAGVRYCEITISDLELMVIARGMMKPISGR